MLGLIQNFEKAIVVFRTGEKEHGYDLQKLQPFKQIFIDTFSGMHTEVLVGLLVQLPDPYFKELIEDELKARRAKARLLKTHGRLRRQGVQVCLV